MKGRDLGELAARNLREAILRNSLTTLGVAVGVASLVAMLSLGVGLQTLASQRLTKSGLFDAVFVTSRRGFGGPGEGPPKPNPIAHEKFKPLDEDARQQFANLPNVVDVYPQIRFLTDVRYQGNSYSTNVLGVPESSRATSAFDAITGKYFSSPAAEEAILQADFAKELSPQTATLVGKEITLRYAERRAVSSDEISKEPDIDKQLDEMMSGGISIVSREKKLRIAGIIESDPSAGIGGFGGGRVFLPIRVAEQLHPAQANDVQDFVRGGGSGKPTYAALTIRAKSPKDVLQIEDAIKKLGFNAFSLLDAARSLRLRAQLAPRLHRLRSLPRTLRQPGAHRRLARHHQHACNGHPRAPPRNRSPQSIGRNRRRRTQFVLRRSRRHGILGRHLRRRAGLANRPSPHLGHNNLSSTPRLARRKDFVRPVVASAERHRLRRRSQLSRRPVPRRTRRPPQPSRSPPLRVSAV